MVNVPVPAVPYSNVNIEQAEAGIAPKIAKIFSQIWYKFFDAVMKFLEAVQASPQQITQAQLAFFAESLGQQQAGVVVWVTAPYQHLLVWTGVGWDFAPGDAQSGFTVSFLSLPSSSGWAQCAGQTVAFLKADGTLGSQVLPNTANLYFRQ